MNDLFATRAPLFPVTAALAQDERSTHLEIGGCDLQQLAEQWGTPLYLYDRATLDEGVAAYRQALARHYPAAAGLTYAGKAFLCTAIAEWARQQGLWLDCTGAGELHFARAAGFPRERILVHGVNKSETDLRAAFEQAGTIVVDNLSELERIIALSASGGLPTPNLWLRFRPGIAVETHSHTQTGQEDSKFGLSAAELAQAVERCLERGMPLTGIHFHQGSHFHDPAPLEPALNTLLDLLQAISDKSGWFPQILCPGGGWGVAYHESELPHPPTEQYVAFIAAGIRAGCQRRGLPLPHLQLEPGRSLVARAGVALYRVGALKKTTHVDWVLLDGGLADNPRVALYGARYSCLPVSDLDRQPLQPVTLAGPFCESGDIMIHDLPMPQMEPGELVAVPVSGAYHLSMGSNYNGALRPAVAWLDRGQSWLIQRRETLAELTHRDVSLPQPDSTGGAGNV